MLQTVIFSSFRYGFREILHAVRAAARSFSCTALIENFAGVFLFFYRMTGAGDFYLNRIVV